MKLFCLLLIVLLAAVLPSAVEAAGKRAMIIDDLFQFKRVSDPAISPDGKWVVYSVTSIDNVAENKTRANLWMAPTDDSAPPRQLTTTEKKDRHPRWSPDGKHILFESTRSGESQLWLIDIRGGEARQLTHIATEAATGIWSRDGKRIAFVSAVYPEFSEKPYKESNEANKKKMEEIKKSPVKAKTFTKLFYRHWDSYVEDKRQHLFVLELEEKDGLLQAKGDPHDATPGDRDAYPTSTTFSVGDDFTFSPDGKYLIFTAVPAKDEAWSTNYDICRVAIDNQSPNWETLTAKNEAADGAPQFSPDGKQFAYRAQKKPGYEADKWDILVCDCNPDGTLKGNLVNATAKLDLSVGEFIWNIENDGVWLLFLADRQGSTSPVAVHFDGEGWNEVREPSAGVATGSYSSLSASKDGAIWAATVAYMHRPAEVAVGRHPQDVLTFNLSHANDEVLAGLELNRPESVSVPLADGKMQMWILKPPGFDARKKWPVAYLVHGGPQGAWEDGWSFRWNPQVWAAQGYIVALPNPRGSTGFGQKFTDEITGDWGGKCYDDLMRGVAYLEKLPYVDSNRFGSAGASFGGYMMNWFAVNTGRFKCLITHCSVWNFDSMYGTTDEVWFDEYEHGGPPWGGNRESYEKHSPHRKAANLAKFKTPMLIIHNDNDFRCPIGQGHELFTALQRQGVPSRFVNFPDEGHWVLKPANSEHWHKEVFAWLTRHVPPGGK